MLAKLRATGKKSAPVSRPIPPTRQIMVVHLSDIHFGRHHRFSPGAAVGPGKLPSPGRASLLESLRKDLAGRPDPGCPVILCLTGDFAEIASADEFREAERFIKQLAAEKIFGQPRSLKNIFIVPGNHDLAHGPKESEDRWSPWAKFCNDTFGTNFAARDPTSRISFHDRVDDLGAIIVCLNSSEYVQKDTPEEKRGVIDEDQLNLAQEFLESLAPHRIESAIRIALIHHHPVA